MAMEVVLSSNFFSIESEAVIFVVDTEQPDQSIDNTRFLGLMTTESTTDSQRFRNTTRRTGHFGSQHIIL